MSDISNRIQRSVRPALAAIVLALTTSCVTDKPPGPAGDGYMWQRMPVGTERVWTEATDAHGNLTGVRNYRTITHYEWRRTPTYQSQNK